MDRKSDHPPIHRADSLPDDDTLTHPRATSRRGLFGLAVVAASSLFIPTVSGCGETDPPTPDHIKDAELITTGFVGEITAVVDTQTPPDYGGGIQPDDPHTAVRATVKVEQHPEAASTFERYHTDSTITWHTMKPRAFIEFWPRNDCQKGTIMELFVYQRVTAVNASHDGRYGTFGLVSCGQLIFDSPEDSPQSPPTWQFYTREPSAEPTYTVSEEQNNASEYPLYND